MKITSALVMSLFIFIAVGTDMAHSSPAEEQAVLLRVEKADKSLTHGSYSFQKTEQFITPPSVSQSEGTISFPDQIKYRVTIKNLSGGLHIPSDSAGTTSKTSTLSPAAQEQLQKIKNIDINDEMYDGKNIYEIYDSVNQVSIVRRKGVSSIDRIIAEYPGPCFIMGRGFSVLANAHIFIGPKAVQIEGRAPDGSDVSATLDPQRDYVANTIERRGNGILLGRWTLANWTKPKHGTYIAGKCTYNALDSTGKPMIVTNTTISKANFGFPNTSLFTVVLGKEGHFIQDNRLGHSTLLTVKQNGPLSPDQVLQQSRQQIEADARAQAEEANYERTLNGKRNALIILPITIVGTTAIIFWTRVRKRRRV